MLNPRRLRVLREVATRGSFSAAAEALAFTQPAVSQQIAALERETGTTLIERGVRPVRLTDAGRALLVHAEAVLAHLDEAQQELGEIAGLRRGRLRLASFPTAIATLVPNAVARFTQRHPDVDLTVVDDHRQGLIPRLARWELDLALIYDHEALPEPEVRLERAHLLDDPFDLLVPDGHQLARRRSVALEELADETWIGGTEDGAYARIVLHSCRVAGFEPRVVFGSDDYNAVHPASSSAATTTTPCRPSSLSAWGLPSSPAWHSRSRAPASPASPWPSRRYGESPQPGWRPASGPQRPRRCSAC